MRTIIGTGLAAAALALLAGCGDKETNAPTAEENAQLDEAANMLDTSPDSLTVENPELGNGDAPTAEAGDVAVAEGATGDDGGTANAAVAAEASNAQ
ncbi:hypothetical protein [Allosphingosinicella deserti]|uniref:Circumsporozoite protein n=1 Tax=Allosphingosinicella deserti TaxID=2116704 RepID=A0A2P7QG18_9SPHN|nr:hypothetical protein [Sphingomonas deserti]PSJ36903.1 hypothetical protein C7I55_24665 [Sphingomonas deserti]